MNLPGIPSSNNRFSLIETDKTREKINRLPDLLPFLYALYASQIQKTIFEKKWKRVEDFSQFRMFLFHIQVLTSLLQNFKHYDKTSWFVWQIVWDLIATIPYPASYFWNEDIITYRTITKNNISEIVMLFSATWTNLFFYFALTGQWEIAALLAIHNKTTFVLAQALKSKNNHTWADQDQLPQPHDIED